MFANNYIMSIYSLYRQVKIYGTNVHYNFYKTLKNVDLLNHNVLVYLHRLYDPFFTHYIKSLPIE